MSNVATLQSTEIPAFQAETISSNALIMSDQNFERVMKFAEVMSTGKVTVPAEMRNVGDCLAVCMQAMMWGMSPFAVMQKTHIISGKLGFEAQLVNAVINRSGVTKDRMHFEWFGPWERVLGKFEVKRGDKGEYRVPNWKPADEEGCGVRAWATIKGEDEPRELVLLLTQARTRNSTLWADDPRQQLAYLAQKRWCRLYAPDVLLGVYTPDELEQPSERDMGTAEVVEPAAPPPATRTNALKERMGVGKDKEAKPAATKPNKKALDEALAAIVAIADKASYEHAKCLCEKLQHQADIDIALAAFHQKMADINAENEAKAKTTSPASSVDPETGEILPDNLEAPAAAGEAPPQDDFIAAMEAAERKQDGQA